MIQVNKPVIVLLHGYNGSLLNFEKLVPNATMYVVEGGGRPNFANAGGSQPDNIDKAIDIAKDYIKKQS